MDRVTKGMSRVEEHGMMETMHVRKH